MDILNLGNIVVHVSANAAGYFATLDAVQTQAMAVSRRLTAIGRTAAMALTLPLTVIGGLAVNEYAKFDDAMTKSLAIMSDVTPALREEMEELARTLSSDGIQAPRELAESYFFLASAGKDAEQSIALLPKVQAFATAGAFDMARATDLLTDAQSALGMTSRDAAVDMENMVKLSDALVGANTLANASVEQFSIALTSKAGAAFKSFNIDMNEGVALLAAYADQGIKAELAGNAADRMIRLLTKAVQDNADEFKRLNIEVFNNEGEMHKFSDIIGDLEQAVGHLSPELRAAELSALGFEARVQSVILPLIGSSEALERYSAELDNMAGITDDVVDKQMESFSAQMSVILNKVRILGEDIGETLAPVLLDLGEWIGDLTDDWKELDDSTKLVIITVAATTAVMGPLLITIGLIGQGVSAIIGTWGALTKVLHAVASQFTVVTARGGGVVLTATQMKVAMAGLVAGGIALAITALKQWADMSEEVAEANQRTSDILRAQIDLIRDRADAMGDDTIEAMQKQLELLEAQADVFFQQWVTSQKTNREMEESLGWIEKTFSWFTGDQMEPLLHSTEELKNSFEEVDAQAKELKQRIEEMAGTEVADVAQAVQIDQAQEMDEGQLEALNKLYDEGARLNEAMRTPAEQYAITQQKLNELHRMGAIEAWTYQRAMEAATEEFEEASRGPWDDYLENLEEQIETFGASAREIELWTMITEGATDAQIKQAEAFHAQLDALEEHEKLMERGKAVTEQYLTPLERFEKTQKELNELLAEGAISQETYDRALEDATSKLEEQQEKFGDQFETEIAPDISNEQKQFLQVQAGQVTPVEESMDTHLANIEDINTAQLAFMEENPVEVVETEII